MIYREFNDWPANPHRLYRDLDNAWLAGVCAGIAEYLGVAVGLVRVAAVLGLIFFLPATVVAYLVLAFVLRPKPPRLFESREDEVFWRGVSAAPDESAATLRRKFRDIEERLARMEAHITSEEFELNRKFRDIGG
jgi:phage shock protein C